MSSRRAFFAALGGAGAAAVGYGLGTVAFAHGRDRRSEPLDAAAIVDGRDPSPAGSTAEGRCGSIEGEDTPLEDLMREHAVLERILLVYEEACRRLEAGADLPPEVLAGAAGIVRRYIEDHHERDEEQHVFPRLVQIGVAVDLVDTLLVQHAAGRRVTSRILELSTAAHLRDADDRARLVRAARRFVRMYRPHAAAENTVLFPALRKAVSQSEYERLRVTLERGEFAAFGPDLYDSILSQVRGLERELGISELATFTPGDDDD